MVLNKVKIAIVATAIFGAAFAVAFDVPKGTKSETQTLYWFETMPDGTPTSYIGDSPSGDCPQIGPNSCERGYLESQVEFDSNGDPTGVISGQEDLPEAQQNRP